MIVDKPFVYFAVLIALTILLLVGFSILRMHKVQKIRISEELSFDASSNYVILVAAGFFFYYLLPSDAVYDYIAYAEYYTLRSMGIYGHTYNYFSSRDILFFNYVEVLSSVGVGYRVAYGAIVALYVFSIIRAARKSQAFPWIVVLLALVFGNLYFVVSGLRQAAAMAFVLLAYGAYMERRWLLAIACIAFATGFHGSALMGVLLISCCIYVSHHKSLFNTLIYVSLLSFPLLWWQLQGKSLITFLLPYISFLIPDSYSGYGSTVQQFDLLQNSVGLGFAFFTLAKLFFIMLVWWLSKKQEISKSEQSLIFIGLFYIFSFNVMGLNEITHRLLNYFSPFLFIAMSLVLVKGADQNSFMKAFATLFILMSGVLALVVAVR